MTRFVLAADRPILLRPDGAVQLGWDPRRAVLVRPPRDMTQTQLADLLRALQVGTTGTNWARPQNHSVTRRPSTSCSTPHPDRNTHNAGRPGRTADLLGLHPRARPRPAVRAAGQRPALLGVPRSGTARTRTCRNVAATDRPGGAGRLLDHRPRGCCGNCITAASPTCRCGSVTAPGWWAHW